MVSAVEDHGGTAERRQRSEAGRGMGSRSASKVPVKRGNGRGTPWRKERHRGTEPLEGQATQTPIYDTVFTQLQRIASRGEPVTLTSRMRQPARPDLWEARVW